MNVADEFLGESAFRIEASEAGWLSTAGSQPRQLSGDVLANDDRLCVQCRLRFRSTTLTTDPCNPAICFLFDRLRLRFSQPRFEVGDPLVQCFDICNLRLTQRRAFRRLQPRPHADEIEVLVDCLLASDSGTTPFSSGF